MKFLSVCSGIEAASAAWTPLGWEAVAFSEVDPFACAFLAHRYPTVPNWGDMTKFQEWPDATFDVLVGGTPCQSFSVAGLRGGMDDDRGNLALVYLEIAGRYRPEWLVWENVPGVLSSNGGGDFGSFLGGLAELGYGFAYRILDAQYAGVPQRRRRVFVVGHLGDWRRAAAVLFERQSLRGDSPPRRAKGQDVAGVLTAKSGGGGGPGGRTDEAAAGYLQPVSMSLNAHGGSGRMDAESETLITHSLRAEGHDASDDGTGRGTPIIPIDLRNAGRDPEKHDKQNRQGLGVGKDGDPAPTLSGCFTPAVAVFDPNQITSKANRSVPTPGLAHTLPGTPNAPIAFSCKDHGADVGESAPTLRAMGHAGSHANAGGQIAVAFQEAQTGCREHPEAGTLRANGPGHDPVGTRLRIGMQVRRLTPRECERLQGFPDDATLIPYRARKRKGEPETGGVYAKDVKDGPRYKAIGNSMAVPVVRWIGERIAMVDELTRKLLAGAKRGKP